MSNNDNDYVNLNSSVFAEEGVRVAPCLGLSGKMYPWMFATTKEDWRKMLERAYRIGSKYFDEAYYGRDYVGACGGIYITEEGGYTYLYITDLYGNDESYAFTTTKIAKEVEEELA